MIANLKRYAMRNIKLKPMAQQTAVEWLQECLDLHLNHEQKMQYEGLFQQAKQMEKEQIIFARMDGMTDDELSYQTAEQYYNETYKKQ